MPLWSRARAPYVALAAGTIAVGLTVHRHGGALSPVARDVLGDALWAALVAWWIAAVAPAFNPRWRAAAALAFSVAIEFSQLYHAPTIDAARRTAVGQLVLGSGFDARDLVAYTAGVLGAGLFERAVLGRRATHVSAVTEAAGRPPTGP